MENLTINATDETPRVLLDANQGKMEFSGKSLPEDVSTFYGPVLKWIDAYATAPKIKTEVIFKLSYFNTASSKLILDILFKLETFHQKGSDIRVLWYYYEDDEDMEEAGREYADLIMVPFEIQAVN